MKKLYSRSLIAFVSPQRDRIKALRIFLLALALSCFGYSGFAQVVVTPANDTTVCAQTALNGSSPACTTLGTITISETLNSDFSAGADRIVLNPPSGWQFCTSPAPTITAAGGGDIPAGPLTFVLGTSSLQIDFTPGGTVLHDDILITGLRIQPVLTTSSTGNIYAFSTTGVAGIVTGPGGTSFGRLGLIPVPITGPNSLCVASCSTFVSSPSAVWTSSNPAIATVSAGGLVCGVSAGSATITATIGGCFQTKVVNISPLPAPIVITDSSLCAWYDSITVSDPTSGGIFTSTLVTADNSLGAGMAKIKAAAPGIGVIRYTLSATGCYVERRVTVNPNPYPIMPLDLTAPYFEICRGSTRIYTCDTGGGTWATASSTVATVTTIAGGQGSVFGAGVGSTKLIYTAPGTGCKTDTTIIVNPLPTPISGDVEICVGEVTTLSSGPCGGLWSIVNPAIASVAGYRGCGDSVDISGSAAGTTIILYTIPSTGCAQITTLTVNPLPTAITGPTSVCVGSTITLLSSPSGGVWRSGDTTVAVIDSVTGDVTGRVAGIDTIYYTLSTGCNVFTVITINPLPSPIVGPDSMCVGDSARVYISFPSGGTWSSSVTAVGVIDGVGFFTPLSPGITDICYTLSTTCQRCKTVTVNPVPAPISGATSLCVGGTGVLADPTPGGTWVSMDTFSVYIDTSGLITGRGVTSTTGTEIRYYVGACYASILVTVHPVPTITGRTSVCQGDTIHLTGIPGGGVWTSQDTTIFTIDSVTGVVTGIASGSINATYTTTGGCHAEHFIDVYDNAPIHGDSILCKYDTGFLVVAVPPGGAWTPLTSTIVGVTTLSSSTGGLARIIGLSAGVETITYTTPAGCTRTFTVTVNPIEPIVGDSLLCVGSTDSLWDPVTPGIWTSSNSSIVSISSTGIITGIDTGVATITYTTGAGCFSVHDVTVNPLPGFIEGDTAVCVGQSTVFISADTGGIWTSSNPGIASVGSSSGVVTGVSAGVAIITYSLPTGCFVTEDIIVHPLSAIFTMDSILCMGDSTTYFDTTSGGKFYSSDPGVATVDTLTGVVHSVSPGVATIYYVLPTLCQASLNVTVYPLPAAIVGKDSVCVGDTVMFVDADTPGTWTHRFGFAFAHLLTGQIDGITPGIDTITYTLPTGCLTQKHIVVNQTPTAIVGPHEVCKGRSTSVPESSTPTTGYWTVVDTSVISPITVTAGAIRFTGKSVDTTLGYDTTSIFYTLPVGSCWVRVTVTVHPIPTIVATGPATIKCKYDRVTLMATGADSAGSTSGTYRWSPAYGLNTTLGRVVSASPTVTTTYTVTGTSSFGCDSFTTITVLVDDSLNNMKIVGDSSICTGECSILMGSGRAHTYYNWHPSVGLSCTICDTVRACPTATTTYWAVAIDDIGCKDSVSFTVNVHPIPVVRVDPNPAIVCRGTPTQLRAFSPNTDDTTNVYTWKPDLFISCDTCYNPVVNDTANIVYRVTGTTIYGCHDSFDVKVSVLDTNLNTISNDTNICIGSAAMLVATSKSLVSNLDIPQYTWLPDNGTLSNPDSSVTLAFPMVTTQYTLAIRENQCFSDTMTVTVFVEPYPDINILANPPGGFIVAGSRIQLEARLHNLNDISVGSYAWAPANTLSCDSCFNPIAIPVVSPTTYTVTVTSIYGCTSSDTISFRRYCDKDQIYVPNTFTPNGDGANDIFYVRGKGIRMITLFQVYNRWGELLFEQRNIQANDITRGWDGTYKGIVLSPDVYVYIVKAECDVDNSQFTYTGDVSIVK